MNHRVKIQGKKMRYRKKSPPERKVSNTEKSRGQLLTAPERMKLLGQSENNAQLECLVVKIMSDAVKKNTAWELGMLGP